MTPGDALRIVILFLLGKEDHASRQEQGAQPCQHRHGPVELSGLDQLGGTRVSHRRIDGRFRDGPALSHRFISHLYVTTEVYNAKKSTT